MVDYASYIRNRITELRIQKDVSEYRMSLDLGQNRNYIQGITSGKALPSMAQFLNICEYLDSNHTTNSNKNVKNDYFGHNSTHRKLAKQKIP